MAKQGRRKGERAATGKEPEDGVPRGQPADNGERDGNIDGEQSEEILRKMAKTTAGLTGANSRISCSLKFREMLKYSTASQSTRLVFRAEEARLVHAKL